MSQSASESRKSAGSGADAARLPHAHIVQMDIEWEDAPANRERVRRLLDDAPVEPGDFVLLPEMFDTGFSFNVERTNDKAGATLAALIELADDLRVTVQGGRTVAACHRCAASNVATVVSAAAGTIDQGTSAPPGGARVVAEYTKVHPFQREAERFEPGREVVVYDAPGWPLLVCPAICYDLRFPELFRAGLAKGAEMFALGACWPRVRQGHWRALLIARAIENQAVVVGCNRTGRDPMAEYAGGSIAVGATGEILGELDAREGVLSVPVDAGKVREWRGGFRAWRDQRLAVGTAPTMVPGA